MNKDIIVNRNSSTGRLLCFVLNPPPLGLVPVRASIFADRLAQNPITLRAGMVRANAYYDAGCPLELCDHAAARDLWAAMMLEPTTVV